MTLAPQREGTGGLSTRRTELLVGLAAAVVVGGVVFASPASGPKILVGLALAAVVAALAVQSPVATILTLTTVVFVREVISFVPGDPSLYSIYGALVVMGVALVRRRYAMPRLAALELAMAAFFLWNLFSMILPHEFPTTDVWRFVAKGVLLPFVMYLAGRIFFAGEQPVRRLLWLITAFTAYSSVMAIMQEHGPKSLVFPKYMIKTSGSWEGRAVGIFDQPVTNGLLLCIGFAVILHLIVAEEVGVWVRRGLVVLALMTAYSVYLTHTRSALLGLVAVLVIGAILNSPLRKVYLGLLAAVVVMTLTNLSALTSADRASGGVASSNEVIDRLNIMATSIRAMAEYPVFGVGVGRFPTYNTVNHVSWSPEMNWARGYGISSHENELGIGAELGVPGLLMWLTVLVLLGVVLAKALRHVPVENRRDRSLVLLGVLAMVVWQVTAFTVDMRFLEFTNVVPWLLAGIAVSRWSATHAPPVPSPRTPGAPTPQRARRTPVAAGGPR